MKKQRQQRRFKIKQAATANLNKETQTENSPEPEDEIMFPDLWTSSNLLKITFNLQKWTKKREKIKNMQTGDKRKTNKHWCKVLEK